MGSILRGGAAIGQIVLLRSRLSTENPCIGRLSDPCARESAHAREAQLPQAFLPLHPSRSLAAVGSEPCSGAIHLRVDRPLRAGPGGELDPGADRLDVGLVQADRASDEAW